ncbi:unnamed protein product [Bursaphelenchus okinawaensis]|uniref:protein xylosyltransferase n=1 Tax=Bursaphelenchus okinawaensis TaxID=465554 RepID=A0A811L3Z0_9BILA|nr:unnamed protein product [Bursaphelenchus okinawaensis]CAG9116868.1 unnamed protein product [Bursaphelenchus okinawaensis]
MILAVVLVLFCINIYCALQLLSRRDQTFSSPSDIIKRALKASKVSETKVKNEDYELGPRCEFFDKAADDVYKRMKTPECKRQLEDHLCEMDQEGWPVRSVANTCPIYDPEIQFQHRGCFRDSSKKRTLTFFKYDLKKSNSIEKCAQFCFRIGARLAGVEYGSECFCGNDIDIIDLKPDANSSICEEYRCPGNEKQFCGGFNAISLYSTGVTVFNKKYPSYIAPETSKKDVKILFLLQLNGRNVRQIKRLLKAIYNPKHLYLVHVDARQKLMHYEVMKIQELLESSGQNNFKVVQERFITIWGGTSLLDMFLDVVQKTLNGQIEGFDDWDFIFNLSESDYPVLSISELEAMLAEHRNKSFMAAHGYNTGSFLKKQGYNYHFFECEERMWRVGPRLNYPANLRVDGGSDWVVINRELAKFAISDEQICVDLRKLFKTILLPLEGFFHTVALNTHFCDKVMYKNLRLTNWKRDQGCRCEGLRHVVDWCGCSPIAIQTEDDKLNVDRLTNNTNYFARKFDWMVDPVTIADAEKNVYRFEKEKLNEEDDVHNGWVSLYDKRYDEPKNKNLLIQLAKALYDKSISTCAFTDLLEINMFLSYKESEIYSIFKVKDDCDQTHEMKVDRLGKRKWLDEEKIVSGYKLLVVEVGSSLDLKEEIFRDDLALISQDSLVTFQWQWQKLKDQKEAANKKKKTSPKVMIEVWSPDKTVFMFKMIEPYNSINYKQHVKIDLSVRNPSAGIHTFIMKHPDTKEELLQYQFTIFPRENGIGLKGKGAGLKENPAGLKDDDLVMKENDVVSKDIDVVYGKNGAELKRATTISDLFRQMVDFNYNVTDKSITMMADRRLLRTTLQALSQLCISLRHRNDPAIVTEIRRLVSTITPEVLEIRLPHPTPDRYELYGNMYGADIYEDPTMSCVVFGMKNEGLKIPLHDHQQSFGFIRVLRGSLRIRSFSFVQDETKKERNMITAKFEGEQEVSVSTAENPETVVFLDPIRGNIHEVTALEAGTAFCDVLTPGYVYPIDCVYYEETEPTSTVGTVTRLKAIQPPRDYITEPLWYRTIRSLTNVL